jgi:hypothetical protein
MTDSDAIVVTCPNCQEQLRVRSVLAGKSTRCPNKACGNALLVPRQEAANGPTPTEPAQAIHSSVQREFEEMVQSQEHDHHARGQRSSKHRPVPEWVWLVGTTGAAIVVLFLVGLMVPTTRARLFSLGRKIGETRQSSVQPADGFWQGVGQPVWGKYRFSFLIKNGNIMRAGINYEFEARGAATSGWHPFNKELPIQNSAFTLQDGTKVKLTGTFITPTESRGSATLSIRGTPGRIPDVTIIGPWTARWINDAEGGK